MAIVVFTEDELAAAKRVFDATVSVPKTACWAGSISNSGAYNVIVAKSDRGNFAATETVRHVIEDFRPRFILAVGTAGAASNRDATLGDVVIGDFVDYTEFRKLVPNRRLRRYSPLDHPSFYLRHYVAEKIRWEQCEPFLNLPRPPWPAALGAEKAISSVVVGNIVAGEKILSDHTSAEQAAILADFEKAAAFETESFGIASAVYTGRGHVHADFRYNLLYLPIRGISDIVDVPGSNATRREWTAYAATAAAALGRAVAEDLMAG